MSLSLREALCAASRTLERVGLNCGTAGNLSVRVADGLLVTPSGVKPERLTPAAMVAMALDGKLADPNQREGRHRLDARARRKNAMLAGRSASRRMK